MHGRDVPSPVASIVLSPPQLPLAYPRGVGRVGRLLAQAVVQSKGNTWPRVGMLVAPPCPLLRVG